MSGHPSIHAPFLNTSFACRKSVITDNRMPYFVRRNELALHLVTEGKFEVIISNGQRVTYPVGRAGFSWGAIPYLPHFIGRVHIYTLTLPLGWVLRWNLPGPFMHAILGGWRLFEPDSAQGVYDAMLMERWHRNMASRDSEVRRVMLMEIETRLHRLGLDIGLSKRRRTQQGPARLLDKVEQVILHIARHYARPLGVAEIAHAVGLHPNYISTLFRQSTGTGLLDFLTQHRVAMAQSLLASTDAKIIDIALAAGFGSVSQFHAVFKRHMNCSPAGYRKLQRLDCRTR